jgi:hypothetical protein
MFLPTKAHTKEIVDDQFKIRLGNRVPKDAVNLAYTHVPAINSDENVLVTDLSNTILENSRNADPFDVHLYPDNSLILQMEDGQTELATEDVLVTNVFKDGEPLYYSQTLSYFHYDEKGPDRYGIYHRDAISIVDRNGQPITLPYQVQLIPATNEFNLYHVVVYTGFRDKESESYTVVYNAVKTSEDGRRETVAGYEEPLNVVRASNRTTTIKKIMELASEGYPLPLYYQAHGVNPGQSKFYVPTPRIKDIRDYQKFRYQIGLEIETQDDRLVFTTPWYSDSVLNPNFLNPEEEYMYENGYKKLTEKTAEDIMKKFVPYNFFEDIYVTLRYFVNIDNPTVEEFYRTDGSSPIYATTTVGDADNQLVIPMNAKTIKSPVPIESKVSFRIRPLLAHSDEVAYVSFIVDNSESMGQNDPEKTLRLQMMEALLYSVRDYYTKNQMNGFVFNHKIYDIREEFRVGEIDLIEAYAKSVIDNDVTNPIPAIEKSFDSLNAIPDETITYDKTYINRKMAILITDGELSSLDEVEAKLIEARDKNIRLAIVCFNNYPALSSLCADYNTLCVNAASPRLMMDLRFFFFNLAGLHDVIDLGMDFPFKIDPQDNEYLLTEINKTSFALPEHVSEEDHRYGIEAVLDDDPWIPEISMYFEEKTTGELVGAYNGANLVTLKSLFKQSGYRVMLHSEAYQFYYAPMYSIRFNDSQKIQLLPPREKDSDHSWYLRLKNGRFDRRILDLEGKPVYQYSIPEYYRQDFLSAKGFPYRQQLNERPQVLNHEQIRIQNTPMYVEFDGEKITNATVRVNGKPIRIKDWSGFDGILKLDGSITHNDEIFVDYEYEEDSYTYRGFYNQEDGRFWHLDLNPSKGHFTTIRDSLDGEVKDVPSFTLINKTIYLYLNPAAKMKEVASGELRMSETVRQSTVFHSFEKIKEKEAALIGEVRIRPNSNQSNIQVIDTRVRGGGLKKEITQAIMKEFEEESMFYWDIGHWDGKPFSENGVIVVRITKSVLKEYGGQYSKAEIEERLNKYMGYGIFPIIEFIDDPDSLLQVPEDLVVEVIDVEEQTTEIEKPTFRLTLEG